MDSIWKGFERGSSQPLLILLFPLPDGCFYLFFPDHCLLPFLPPVNRRANSGSPVLSTVRHAAYARTQFMSRGALCCNSNHQAIMYISCVTPCQRAIYSCEVFPPAFETENTGLHRSLSKFGVPKAHAGTLCDVSLRLYLSILSLYIASS